jgi:hypothetical protein
MKFMMKLFGGCTTMLTDARSMQTGLESTIAFMSTYAEEQMQQCLH